MRLRVGTPFPIALFAAIALFTSSASAQEREPWDGGVVGVQSATVVLHGLGSFVGMLPGAFMLIDKCLLTKDCSRSYLLTTQVVTAVGATALGTLAGGSSTWGAGRLMDSPAKLLPTLGFAAIGHSIGGVVSVVWADATDYDDDNAWWVSLLIGSALGTAGAVIGANAF